MNNYTRLTMQERCNLACFLDMGLSISSIAKRLGRHRSTLYRELARNHTKGHYRPGLTHSKANKRHPRKALKLQTNTSLYHYVYDRLTQGWSPEQIVGRMRLESKLFTICHETIYQYVYKHGQKTLWKYLPSKRLKRRKRHERKRARCLFGDIRLITKRPEIIDKRHTMGHWEGDLIAFKGGRQKTVTTLVERKTRMLFLVKNTTKMSFSVMNNISHKFSAQPTLPCLTITFDQGTEFADYGLIEKHLGCKIYYCEPRSPWQKGSNENMNGRLRRYLPKKINIDKISQEELDQLANKMNNLPRRCLDFKTPKELFLKLKKKSCRTES